VRVACIGGGPAGLYLGILLARSKAGHEVDVFERNAPDDTFGFGVVFSDQTLDRLQSADPESYRAITESFAHWDDIDITTQKGEVFTSKGHGFSGMSRKKLLEILTARALELGVRVHHHHEITDFDKLRTEYDLVMAADGVNSAVRQRYAAELQPEVSARPNRFVWLGSTFPFEAFTFWFKEDQHGLWRVHAYRYDDQHSTFILECTEATWRAAGMDRATEAETIAFAEKLFAEELRGHPLIGNRSIWRAFPVIRLGRWAFDNLVVLGDACHTAHYSIGSGTKLAMEDAISLYEHLVRAPDVRSALAAYQAERKPVVDSTQRSAQVSLEWFEETERYWRALEPLQFAFSLLTRSLRVTHSNLRLRDPVFVDKVDRDYADRAFAAASRPAPASAPPPMFTPLKLRELTLENRVVVSPMCQYSAEDGSIDDWHLVHLGSRAIGGAGLVITEMTDVSPTGRITPGCAGLYAAAHVPAWKRVVDFVHHNSWAKLGVQLAHAGRKGSTKRLWEGMDQPLDHDNWPLIAPSPLPYKAGSQVPREMTRADMDVVVHDFVRATTMADEAGFDLVEVHMAHGYLLATFLSPLTNRRLDEYGGSLEGRLRFPLEVLRAVRRAWPAHKPISVRLSAHDWAPGGTTPDDAVHIAKAVAAAGADIIDVSSGQTVSDEKPVYGRLFQTPFADRVRLEAGVRTMTVGNISSYADVNSILAAGRADLCVLARAHLYDPYWTRHAAQAQNVRLPWPPQYTSLSRYSPRGD
jgi:anthraniloyl-CoA monooxygenase